LRLCDRPFEGQPNEFVITEDADYFVPCLDNSLAMIEILGEVFDLDDPRVDVTTVCLRSRARPINRDEPVEHPRLLDKCFFT
jgi:hypothetical protein